eukprot:TRINITY_DN6233_c0_g1_i1.p1 TRINITY_DN6233_c0_g1~~TRINITY_DN6233_c0_g1_i1.p1  ORF type:complete len:798 (-),score=214.32 TRINITY_DN6233_c0_g1_i1:218-2611(-)
MEVNVFAIPHVSTLEWRRYDPLAAVPASEGGERQKAHDVVSAILQTLRECWRRGIQAVWWLHREEAQGGCGLGLSGSSPHSGNPTGEALSRALAAFGAPRFSAQCFSDCSSLWVFHSSAAGDVPGPLADALPLARGQWHAATRADNEDENVTEILCAAFTHFFGWTLGEHGMVKVGDCFVERAEHLRFYDKHVHGEEDFQCGVSFRCFFSGDVLCLKVFAHRMRVRPLTQRDFDKLLYGEAAGGAAPVPENSTRRSGKGQWPKHEPTPAPLIIGPNGWAGQLRRSDMREVFMFSEILGRWEAMGCSGALLGGAQSECEGSRGDPKGCSGCANRVHACSGCTNHVACAWALSHPEDAPLSPLCARFSIKAGADTLELVVPVAFLFAAVPPHAPPEEALRKLVTFSALGDSRVSASLRLLQHYSKHGLDLVLEPRPWKYSSPFEDERLRKYSTGTPGTAGDSWQMSQSPARDGTTPRALSATPKTPHSWMRTPAADSPLDPLPAFGEKSTQQSGMPENAGGQAGEVAKMEVEEERGAAAAAVAEAGGGSALVLALKALFRETRLVEKASGALFYLSKLSQTLEELSDTATVDVLASSLALHAAASPVTVQNVLALLWNIAKHNSPGVVDQIDSIVVAIEAAAMDRLSLQKACGLLNVLLSDAKGKEVATIIAGSSVVSVLADSLVDHSGDAVCAELCAQVFQRLLNLGQPTALAERRCVEAALLCLEQHPRNARVQGAVWLVLRSIVASSREAAQMMQRFVLDLEAVDRLRSALTSAAAESFAGDLPDLDVLRSLLASM